MASNNPIIKRMTESATKGDIAAEITALQAQFDSPARGGTADRMTIDDVVAKTAVSFVALLLTAAYAWMNPNPVLMIVGALGGFVLALVNSFKRNVSPVLVLAYAGLEGLFVGGISRYFQEAYPGVVSQAVLGTLVAFGVMLGLYSTKIIRVNAKFMKIFMISLISYAVIGFASFIAGAFFKVGDGWGFYGMGQLGVLLCVAGVALAAFSLVMDFEAIQQAIVYGAPRKEAWRGAFGLMVTLIWLYLELLRLLAILQGRD